MYEKINKIKPGQFFRALVAGISLAIFSIAGIGSLNAATDLRITDENPMAMPQVGSYGLRILTPTTLELTLITTKAADPAGVTNWNFVSNGSLNAPSPSQFQVTAGSQTISVQSVGFKRRPLYAPLNYRDLRIGNQIYLQLASPIPDGASVTVKNPGGALWGSDKDYTDKADPLRFNPAIHVNQEGYMPNYAKKAMVGYYLGNLGEMSIPSGNGFKIVDADSGAVVYSGSLTLRKDVGYSYSPTPYQQVYEADFTAFKTPGEYRLQIPGMGASYAFMIDEGVAATFARSYALGLYHQRCGFANDYPYTRHDKGVCHNGLVEIPDMSFSAVNAELANMTGDSANYQTAPQLKDVNSSLYPFINKTAINMRGGHHDAGDYSKYTINVAQLAHTLMFAVDSMAGVASLDNLGLPESGDGISDVMQEAKWELDFLAKMQDADGGFYFLVYPKTREYEDNVSLRGNDLGDSQVVFPKTTHVTAAAVAALAQAASSPKFKAAYPNEAADYLAKAKKGWQFLENAWAKYGRAGAFQKITHYGLEFKDADEIAWAACEMYLATGDQKYHTELKNNFNPSDPNTRRWTWWRMFEGYGCAIRSYAFAVRSGRVSASALDSTYLAKCEAEIVAAGDDQLRYSKDNAYGNPFPTPNKPYRSAGWFMSAEQTFDVAAAYQISAKQEYFDALLGAMGYEAGLNPLNMGFVTGVGWKRQRETVNQYAENDRRILPPSGIPIGSVWPGEPNIWQYKTELGSLVFPSDSTSVNNMFAPYEKWTDTFNTATEMVNPQQGRSLAAMAWFMAQTSLKNQAWKPVQGTISGLPATVPANEPVTATLSAPGVDLSKATIVWEARDQEPTPAAKFTFSAVNTGPQWVEAEALLPDGRRIFAKADFNATTATNTPPNSTQSAPLAVSQDMAALYHLDGDFNDATGKQGAITKSGNTAFDSSNLGWMQNRTGENLHFLDIGDQATGSVSYSDTWASDTQGIAIEAMVYVNAYKGYNKANATILSLERNWNAYMELREDMYAGPTIRLGTASAVAPAQVNAALTKNVWHHLRLALNKSGYTVTIDGKTIATIASSDLNNWAVNAPAKITLGNFDGWIDEVVVRHTRTSYPNTGGNSGSTNVVSTVATPAISPNGGTFTNSASVSLATTTSDATIRYTTDGSAPTTASPVYSAAFTLTNSATVKAQAFATGMSNSVVATANFTIVPANNGGGEVSTVAAPTISPNGGSFTNSTTVTIASATAGATVYYTKDGSAPTTASSVYTAPITISDTTTIRALAVKTGMNNSAVVSASFTVIPQDNGGPVDVVGNSATFVKADTATKGTWKGIYGADGYNVIGDASKNPAYATVTASGKADWTWQYSTTDANGLQKVNASDRVLALWYAATSFTLDVNVTDGKAHRMALYFTDWDNLGRAQTIEILDGNTGAVLNSQNISGFQSGRYLVWDVSGKIKVRVTKTTGSNCILNGLFFDAGASVPTQPANAAPTVSLTANSSALTAGASVTLTATASDSDGSVAKVEFFNGTTKLGESTSAPYTYTWSNLAAGNFSLTAKATDNTGASTTSSAVNITVTNLPVATVAAPTFSPNGGTFTNSATVSLSAAAGTTIRYTTDGSTPTSLSPIYTAPLTFVSTKTVKAVAFSSTTNSTVASATFTIVSGPVTPPASGNKVVFVKTDTTTRGNWKGVYGGDGYNVIADATKYPGYASVSASGKADWMWMNSSSDANALQKANSSDRILGLWYSATSFTMDVNVTDGKSHQLALYFLDWDKLGRAQTVEILDAETGAVLNSQTVSGFSSGRYLVWQISGKTKVRITRTAGSNAILNGIFFDAAPVQTVKSTLVDSSAASALSQGQFQILLNGLPGQTLVVERSSDLLNWTGIATNTLSTEQQMFVDNNATAGSYFYRAVPME